MGENDILELLKNSIIALDNERVTVNTTRALKEGIDPLETIEHGLLPGLNIIGEKFENDEVFLPELMRAAETFQSAMAILQPKIQDDDPRTVLSHNLRGIFRGHGALFALSKLPLFPIRPGGVI